MEPYFCAEKGSSLQSILAIPVEEAEVRKRWTRSKQSWIRNRRKYQFVRWRENACCLLCVLEADLVTTSRHMINWLEWSTTMWCDYSKWGTFTWLPLIESKHSNLGLNFQIRNQIFPIMTMLNSSTLSIMHIGGGFDVSALPIDGIELIRSDWRLKVYLQVTCNKHGIVT